jgi:DNA polymerase-3 subunit alpha
MIRYRGELMASNACWVPLRTKSWYSLRSSASDPQKIVGRSAQLEYPAVGINDLGSISSAVKFLNATKGTGVKPLYSSDIYVRSENGSLSNLLLIPKNRDGWNNLIAITSKANRKENLVNGKPSVSFSQLEECTSREGYICITGNVGSYLGNSLFTDVYGAYSASSYDKARDYVLKGNDLLRKTESVLGDLRAIFGEQSVFLEVALADAEFCPASRILGEITRWAAKKFRIPVVATQDAYYTEAKLASDHRVILSSLLRSSLRKIDEGLEKCTDPLIPRFFKSSNYGLPFAHEVSVWATEAEMRGTLDIEAMVEDYSILNNTIIPNFGPDDDKHLMEICRQGMIDKNLVDKPEYEERLEHELGVFSRCGMAGYMLTVLDYIQFAHRNGIGVGSARGSSGASLVAFTSRITQTLDPIVHDLDFSRFYNEGRVGSLADVDTDFDVRRRDEVIDYCYQKHGTDNVAAICTFSGLKGRAAVKVVCRAHEISDYEAGAMTKIIPDPAAISEELQEMLEEEGESSIIRYALMEYSKELSEWAVLEDDGSVSGVYGSCLEQAIRIENSKQATSRHASGIIISDRPIANTCPLLYDPTIDRYKTAFEFTDAEKLGLLKFDILGTSPSCKLSGVQSLCLTGKL